MTSHFVFLDIEQYKAQLFDPVYRGDWETAKRFLDHHPEGLRVETPTFRRSVLHIAVTQGHLNIVKELVDRLEEKDLETQRADGLTPLGAAIEIGSKSIAECLIKKNKKLLTILLNGDTLPVLQAIQFSQKHMVRYLYHNTPLEFLAFENGGKYGAGLIFHCIRRTIYFDLALELLDKAPHLAITEGYKPETSPVVGLAFVDMSSIESSTFWQRWISKYCIDEKKSLQDQYLALLHCVCKSIKDISDVEQIEKANVAASFIIAASKGNVKLITNIARANPTFVWDSHIAWEILEVAIKYRQPEVFSLIYGLRYRQKIVCSVDKQNNTLLHHAASIAPPRLLNRIPGAALQMQRELQWYKEVESMTHVSDNEFINDKKWQARALFTENHKDLVIAGEKWMKDTASSSTVVGALIVTITFSVAFTFPGGNDQNTGFPMFLHEKYFNVFMMSNAIALFSSTTSVLVFLGILTSRYAEEDFLKSLPTKLIIGLSTLFMSIAAMIITFCVGVSIMFHGKKWIVIPSICFASIPVLLYWWMQFPLLVDIALSTYGPSIFNRKVKYWI